MIQENKQPSEDDLFLGSLKVSTTGKKRAKIGCVYAAGGTGKSGLCSLIDNVFFMTIESGNDWLLNTPMFRNDKGISVIPQNIAQARAMFKILVSKKLREERGFPPETTTIVIDSLGSYEKLVMADVIANHPTVGKDSREVRSITDLGYDGRGWAMDYWDAGIAKKQDGTQMAGGGTLFGFARAMVKQGINVVFITHAKRQNEVSGGGDSFKVWDLDLMDYGAYSVPQLIKKECDFVLFMKTNKLIVQKTEGSGQWSRTNTVASSDSSGLQVMIQCRENSMAYAKARISDEMKLNDYYLMSPSNRKEIADKIFNALFERNNHV